MSSKISLLLIGASGFIGGTVLTTLLARKDYLDRFAITVLIRGAERATLVRENLGLDTVVADLSDRAAVVAAAENADVVINTANADHPEGAAALVEGLTNRKSRTGNTPTYIHFSGTGALTDQAEGGFAADKVYDDEHVDDIKAIPVTYVHRACDTIVSTAGEKGDIRSYIIMPPLIYGRGTGPFHRTSVQIPALIRGALRLGQSCHYGQGLPLWNAVHVQDLADLSLLLLEDALSTAPKAPHGAEGFYFCATDSFQWKQLAEEIGQRLHAHGVLPTEEVRPFTDEEAAEALGTWSGFAYGSNSRSKAIKAHKLGWKPIHGDAPGQEGLFDSIVEEFEAVIEEGKDQAPKVHFDEMYALSSKK
ncbi:hypothetical protein H0H81_002778 [Sphagnurus paluster]|uniref:NAD(P)-binding domain-containing protein n=1 Tax=Sphagnurus paluster TaxID=117069 RepID=A0A9P7FX16_9AGAR|nr:hypothetical protein H0H81_002778 [Sphagnurus paluster]